MTPRPSDKFAAEQALYQDAVENIRFAKLQQWRVTNYAVAIYAAALFLRTTPPLNTCGGKAAITSLLVIVCAFSLFRVVSTPGQHFQIPKSDRLVLRTPFYASGAAQACDGAKDFLVRSWDLCRPNDRLARCRRPCARGDLVRCVKAANAKARELGWIV
jgi:hypothetical protein